MSNPKPLKFAALLQSLGFLAVLVVPLVTTDFRGVQKVSPTENRNLNEFPAWSWDGKALDAFPAKFDAAFSDHFGFRTFMVRWYSRFKLYGLGVSPVEDVAIGKQGWLYLKESIKEYRGVKRISKSEREQWARELKAKQAWLAARHIRYLLVVPPNKEEVYPEFLPNHLFRMSEYRYLDDILSQLGRDSGVEILDLRETLSQGKKLGLTYDRTDTHWSQLGMFLGTNQIIERLQKWYPDLRSSPLSERTLSPQRGPGGDLATMIGLQDELLEDRLVVGPGAVPFEPAPLRFKFEWPKGSLKEPPMAFESKGDNQNLTVLVTGDSFGKGLMRFLPEHFRRVVRLRPPLPYTPWFQALIPQLIEAEKPDIYLDVFSSRSLKHPPRVGIGDATPQRESSPAAEESGD